MTMEQLFRWKGGEDPVIEGSNKLQRPKTEEIESVTPWGSNTDPDTGQRNHNKILRGDVSKQVAETMVIETADASPQWETA